MKSIRRRFDASTRIERLRAHDFRASLTIVCLVLCSISVFLLSSAAGRLGLP